MLYSGSKLIKVHNFFTTLSCAPRVISADGNSDSEQHPTSLGYGDVHANNRVQSNPQLTQPNVNYLGFDITELDEDREILQFLEGTDDVSIEDATDLPSEGKKRKQAPEARKRRKRKRVRRMCTIEGCLNRVVQGGVCIAHGAKRKQCSFPGCDKSVKKAGLCSTHGPAASGARFLAALV